MYDFFDIPFVHIDFLYEQDVCNAGCVMNGYSQGSCSDQILITAKGRSVNRIVLKPARPIPIGPGSIYIHRGCSLGPVWLASATHPLHTILAPHSIEIG